MKIEPFALERWMTTHELYVEYDIAESGIFPWTLRELLELLQPDAREEALARLLDLRLGYNEATGTAELREVLAATYQDATADNILVTTGA
ncbi:MAG: aspartate aminotransferase, partial [Anaerolineae bacterium]